MNEISKIIIGSFLIIASFCLTICASIDNEKFIKEKNNVQNKGN